MAAKIEAQEIMLSDKAVIDTQLALKSKNVNLVTEVKKPSILTDARLTARKEIPIDISAREVMKKDRAKCR
ncbi:MAG: hypothetical protein HY973_02225 [Candidatus Kerfeldbacteria bacterium]|nr:hypothetical protein [Candidatus Kerfeldbacteria bacterium]